MVGGLLMLGRWSDGKVSRHPKSIEGAGGIDT